jgi:hypothetical protein
MRSKNWKHRLLSLTMCLALALTLLPAGAAAVEGSTTTAGGIVVSADSADGYSVGSENYVTINKGGSYTVTDNPDSTEPGAQINVEPTDGKTVYLTLNGVSMKELYISSESAKTDVVLTLEGVNTVSDGIKMADGNCSLQLNLADGSSTTVTGSGTGTAGINVPAGAALTINGDTGVLAANGHGYVGDHAGSYANPGIGCCDNFGSITINGGHITAVASQLLGYGDNYLAGSAAIGGGATAASDAKFVYHTGGAITINGGTVTASGLTQADGVAIGDNADSSTSSVTIGKNAVVHTTGTCAVKTGSFVNNGILTKTGTVSPAATGTGVICADGGDMGSGLDLSSLPAEATYYTAGSGYALWEPTLTTGAVSGGTLTLNNATIAGAGSGTQFTGVKLPSVPVTVKMQGTNAITASNTTSNCGIGYGANTTIELAAGSSTTIAAQTATTAYGIYGGTSGAALTIQGSGALTVSTAGSAESKDINAGSGSVQLLGGTLSMTAGGEKSAHGVCSGALTLGGVTVPAGITLDLTKAAGVTQAEGTTAANNGVLVLPAGTQMKNLTLAGTGMVKIDTGKQDTDGKEIYDIYTSGGVQQTVITGTTKLANSSVTNASGYTYMVDETTNTAALVLNDNTVFDGGITLPAGKEITISSKGATTIMGNLYVAQSGSATNLTISGGSLTVGGIDNETGAAVVTVKGGAKVVSGPVSVGGSNAGELKVTGSGTSLTAAGDNYGGAALSAGSVTLSGGAAVDAASTTGPAVHAINGSVSVTGGAKLTTHCAYGVYVKNGTFTVDRDSTFTDTGATTAAVCVVNTASNCLSLANLPAGNKIASVTGTQGTYWSVVSTGSTLGVTNESEDPVTLTGAVKSLTLKAAAVENPVYSTAYTLTASAGENGAISPSGAVNVTAGDSKTFAITPAEGFAVADVLVDGKSVGAVTTYTFEKVFASHTIAASFVKTSTYSDVKPDDWFHDDVEYVTKQKLMNGTGNGNFSPYLSTTRAMIVTVLWRLAGSPAMEDYGYPYGDVNARTSVYAPAIYWARAQNVAIGYTDDKFGPSDPITREQLAAMLYRYAGLKKYDVTGTADLTGYSDASAVSRYAKRAVSWAVGAKLMQGDANRLNARGRATRAEVAAMLARFCKNLVK